MNRSSATPSRTLTSRWRIAAFTAAALLFFAWHSVVSVQGLTPANETLLENGIRIVALDFPGSANVSIFTFLPLGLTSDGPDQAQWSHLVEHLVIRSTIPEPTADANAETLADHMRLDFYGTPQNWREGLSHHRRWIEGIPFTEESLAAEKPKVAAECDFTAKNFATHKFAVAAWSHAVRHGKTHVALKGDVARATLAEIQSYRNERLATPKQVTVWIAGGVATQEALDEASRQLSDIQLPETTAKKGGRPSAPGKTDLTWDLAARHLIITWPMPDSAHADSAPLLVVAQCLRMRLFGDEMLKLLVGMIMTGTDLQTPEGRFAYVSVSLRSGADCAAVQDTLFEHVMKIAGGELNPFEVVMIGRQFAMALKEVPDARALKLQSRPGSVPGMLEANATLMHAMQHQVWGKERLQVAHRLPAVSVEDARRSAATWLAKEKAAVCMIKPQ